MMILLAFIILAMVLAFKALALITKIWLKVFAFCGIMAVAAIIIIPLALVM